MLKFRFIIAVLVFVAVGCRCVDCDKIYAHWFWEDAHGTENYLNAYKHILVIRVDEDHWENRGPHRLSLHHFKGSVVRIYKGDWEISDRIGFVMGLDYPVSAAATSNRCVGEQLVLLTNEHTDSEIGLDTGDEFRYDLQFKQVLQCVFSDKRAE